MANNKDFITKNPVEVSGSIKSTLGTSTNVSQSDLTQLSYSGNSKTANNTSLSYPGVTFSPDGYKMYFLDNSDETIEEYTLSTAWDVTTASYVANKDITGYGSNHTGLAFSSDGTKVIVADFTSLRRFTLGTAWDITSLTFSGRQTVSIGGTQNRGINIKPNGLKIFWAETSSDVIYQAEMSSAYDLTSLGSATSFSVTSESENPLGVALSSDGTKMWVTSTFDVASNAGGDLIYRYTLSTPWDVSTATYDSFTFDVNPFDTQPYNLFAGDNDTKLWVMGYTSDTVYELSTSSTVTQLDLSTGNYFAKTPAGATTYAFTNPADTQTFQLEITGGKDDAGTNFDVAAVTASFGATVTTGVDLTAGGLVVYKTRFDSYDYYWADTERGTNKALKSNSGAAQITYNDNPTFTTTGLTLGASAAAASGSMAFWSFKKKAGFFDMVTYAGSASNQDISHNLGSKPGMVIVKSYDQNYDWAVRHQSLSTGNNLVLNSAGGEGGNGWFPSDSTASTFTVKGNTSAVNTSGANYIAYLFGHDESPDGIIRCGSYTGAGSSERSVYLGWQPQFIMTKNTVTTGQWAVFDTTRGIYVDPENNGNDNMATWNRTDNEVTNAGALRVTSTGFILDADNTNTNSSGVVYVYMAIRDTEALSLTWPSAIEWAGGVAPAAPGTDETDLYTFTTDDGGTTYHGFKTADNFS